jgi:hypothetical protein
MKSFRLMSLNLALLALLATGGVSASAKTSNHARKGAISGVVTGIDIENRIIAVREKRGGRTIRMRVPEGATVRTNLTLRQNLPLDQLLVGTNVRGLYVR